VHFDLAHLWGVSQASICMQFLQTACSVFVQSFVLLSVIDETLNTVLFRQCVLSLEVT